MTNMIVLVDAEFTDQLFEFGLWSASMNGTPPRLQRASRPCRSR